MELPIRKWKIHEASIIAAKLAPGPSNLPVAPMRGHLPPWQCLIPQTDTRGAATRFAQILSLHRTSDPPKESERASRAGISPNGQRSEEAALRSRSERRAGPSESRGEPRRPPNRRPAAGRLAAPPSRAGQGSERVADQTSRTVCPFFSETFEHDEIVFFRATECPLGSRCELRKLQCNLL